MAVSSITTSSNPHCNLNIREIFFIGILLIKKKKKKFIGIVGGGVSEFEPQT